MTRDDYASLRRTFMEWLIKQGPWAVLVFAAMFIAIPRHLTQIQDGYRGISADHKTAVEKLVESFDRQSTENRRAMERVVERIDDERKQGVVKRSDESKSGT